MNRSKWGALLAGLLLGVSPLLMAPTGGLPSRPRFQTVTVAGVAGSDAVPNVVVNNAQPTTQMRISGGAADEKIWENNVFSSAMNFYTFDDGLVSAHFWLRAFRTGAVVSNVTFGNAADAPTFTFSGAGTTTLGGRIVDSGDVGGNANVALTNTSASDGRTVIEFNNARTTTRQWTLGIDPGGGVTKAFELRDVTGGTVPWSVSTAGVMSVPGNVTVAGQSVCRQDGTNCPVIAGATFAGVSTAAATRTSTTTTTCDAALTVSLPNATARYKLSAFLRFSGGGITANGWRVTLLGAGGTVGYNYQATMSVATTTTNVAPLNQISGNADPVTALFNLAGIDTYVNLDGTIAVTSPTAPTLCISWAQSASNATATTLNAGSALTLTRLN